LGPTHFCSHPPDRHYISFVKELIHEKQIYSKEIRGYLHQLLDSRLIADTVLPLPMQGNRLQRIELLFVSFGRMDNPLPTLPLGEHQV